MGACGTADTNCFHLVEIPLAEYGYAQTLQNRCVAARHDNRIDRDLLILVEHRPVFTFGRNGGRENLMVSDRFLAENGVDTVQAERGGNITYHGPGQLVGYPILNLDTLRLAVKDYVKALETVLLETASAFGVAAGRNPVNAGIWVDGSKLGSIGICLRRGIAFHGFALNVNNDLTPFSWINPCGLKNVGMTSMGRELGTALDMAEVRAHLKSAFERVFGARFALLDQNALEKLLDSTPPPPRTPDRRHT